MRFLVFTIPFLCGCSLFEIPGRMNELALELRETAVQAREVAKKIDNVVDDPEGFVNDAMAGAIKGGMRGLAESFDEQSRSLDEASSDIDDLQKKALDTVKAGAGFVGGALGLPPGPVSQGTDILLGLMGLHGYRSWTRKKALNGDSKKA